MVRYHIKYNDSTLKEVFNSLPLEDKDIWNIHSAEYYKVKKKVYDINQIPQVDHEIILVDVGVQFIDISLDLQQVNELLNKGFKVTEVSTEIPQYHSYNQWVKTVDNPDNSYPTTPSRTETYIDDGVQVLNRNFAKSTIAGEIIDPTMYYLNIIRGWRKGLTGLGVKICVIDEGYDINHIGHEDVEVEDSYTFGNTINDHHMATLGMIGARRNNKGIVGGAYNATMYAADANSLAASISWGYLQGCRIFNCSFSVTPDAYVKAIIKKVIDNGCIVIVSAGNSLTTNLINPLGGLSGVVVIGGTDGGATLPFTDNLTFQNILPINGKGVDFILPCTSINTVTPVPGDGSDWTILSDWYKTDRGSSFNQFAAICALMMEKYPIYLGTTIVNIIKLKSRKVGDYYVPQNVF